MNPIWLIAIAFAVLVVWAARRHWGWFKADICEVWDDARAEWGEGVAAIRAKEAAARTAEVVAWYRAQAKPALQLTPFEHPDPKSAPARLGGPVWLAEGEMWPRDREGRLLEHVATINFGGLPPLEGFPAAGLARFFVGRDDIFGADFDRPEASEVRVLWCAASQDGGRYEAPFRLEPPDDLSPFQSDTAREHGVALAAESVIDPPDAYSWQVAERIDEEADEERSSALHDAIFTEAEERPIAHRLGGHPSFTQYDFRKRGMYDDYDTVLLALTSDDAIMWGDVGEAVFMIRREDLLRRDFSRVAFYWDCH